MYFDDNACRVCGAEVRLEARTSSLLDDDGPVGPSNWFGADWEDGEV